MNPLPFRKPLTFRSQAAAAAPAKELPSDIVTALTEQVDCYRRLAKLAQIQHEHVRREQVEALLEVLSQRQGLLSEIARLEQVVSPAKRDWASFSAPLSSDARSKAEALLAEARSLLESITQSDKDDVLTLQQRKLNLGRQINQATAAKQVNRNYAHAAYGPAKSRIELKS